MLIPTFQIVILLINRAKGSDTTEGYDCQGEICIPKGYNPLDSPLNRERNNPFGSGKMKVTQVHFNFLDMKDVVKKVDDNKMMITFQATAIMVWEDPSLKVKRQILGKIWRNCCHLIYFFMSQRNLPEVRMGMSLLHQYFNVYF